MGERAPRGLTGSVRRATGIRLTVLLPVLLVTLTVAVGLWSVYLTTGYLGAGRPSFRSLREVQALRVTVFLVVSVGGGLALLLGIALAYSISRPIRQLLRRVEEILPPSMAIPRTKKIDELADLTNTLNHLLLSFEKYAARAGLIEQLPEGLVTLSPSGEILSANPEACRILGLGPEEFAGTKLGQFLEPSDTHLLPALRQGAPATVSRLTLIMRDGGHAEAEARLLPVEGRHQWILALRDLVQVRTVEREIRRVDRLAALGGLGASVVHEIGGSVQAIRTLVDLITPLIPPESAEQRYVKKIDAELERVRHLADEIRTLAQVEPRELVRCQVDVIVADALWMAESRFRGKTVRVVKRIPATLPALWGDPERLNRAILNVLVNAFEATPVGGEITVAVAEDQLPASVGSGRGVVVRVANTGSYLSPEEQVRVFDLFYTTKKEGSGLGLPVAYRAVTDHGGTVTVRSSREEGTEFSIFLPQGGTAPP
jgi:two-component system sensor histidine kinase HydH